MNLKELKPGDRVFKIRYDYEVEEYAFICESPIHKGAYIFDEVGGISSPESYEAKEINEMFLEQAAAEEEALARLKLEFEIVIEKHRKKLQKQKDVS